MNELLNKFENIEVKNDQRISSEEMEFCKNEFKLYSNAHKAYTAALNEITKCWNEQGNERYYLTEYSECGIREMQDKIVRISRSFAGIICSYFSKKYSLEISVLDEYDCFNKYRDSNEKLNLISIDFVLDKIFESLNGLTFKELAVIQMLRKNYITSQEWNSYRESWNYEVKNKTIKFKTFNSDIKKILYYYDNNEVDIIDCYTRNKVEDQRSYNNGNVDIKFFSAEFANEFAKRYLGYVEMTKEQREEMMKK